MSDSRPPLAAALGVFGTPATFGIPADPVIIADTGKPVPALGDLGMPALSAVAHRTEIGIPTAAVPDLKIGTTFSAALDSRGVRDWRVDRILRRLPDEWRVVVS